MLPLVNEIGEEVFWIEAAVDGAVTLSLEQEIKDTEMIRIKAGIKFFTAWILILD